MPERAIVAKELAELLAVLGHPMRVRIVEELRHGERNVNELHDLLDISHSEASRHLSILRAHNLVGERREGRHHYYRLKNPELAEWVTEGLKFIFPDRKEIERMQSAVERVRSIWSAQTRKKPRSGK